jgi:hypothetical protein
MNTINWKNATPEQKNLWDYARTLIAWTTITPIFYTGTNIASEFLTYNAGKLYIALELEIASQTIHATLPLVQMYDMANANHFNLSNNQLAWDTTAAAFKYFPNYVAIKNFYFSKLVFSATLIYMKFNGYRLNV